MATEPVQSRTEAAKVKSPDLLIEYVQVTFEKIGLGIGKAFARQTMQAIVPDGHAQGRIANVPGPPEHPFQHVRAGHLFLDHEGPAQKARIFLDKERTGNRITKGMHMLLDGKLVLQTR